MLQKLAVLLYNSAKNGLYDANKVQWILGLTEHQANAVNVTGQYFVSLLVVFLRGLGVWLIGL